MKFLCSNDWHLSTRNPVARTDDYEEELFQLLDQIKRLAIKVQAKAILNAGDLFHEPLTTKHSLVNRLATWLQELKDNHIEFIAIPGNHDIRFDRYATLPETPIETLFRTGLMRNVSFCHYQFTTFRDDVKVRVYGIPYPEAKSIESFNISLPKSTEYSICLAHCFATPAGGLYYDEQVHAYTQLASLPFDIFVFGHDHSDNGVVEVNGKWFVNIGALSRGSRAKENINRSIKVALIDIEHSGIKIQQVRLNYRPASEIFDLELKAKKDRETAKIVEFTEKITEDLEAATVDYKDKLVGMEMSQEVRNRVSSYIERAELNN